MAAVGAKKMPVQIAWGITTLLFGRWVLLLMATPHLKRWVSARIKTLLFHPIVCAELLILWWTRHWFPIFHLVAFGCAYVALGICMWKFPLFYRHHIDGRLRATMHRRRWRRNLRSDMKACGLISDKDKTPVVLGINETPVLARVRIQMHPGGRIKDFRDQADRLAPTKKCLDVKAYPVRVDRFAGFLLRPPFVKLKKKDLPHQVQLNFLTVNPFTDIITADYIDHFLDASNPLPVEGNAAAMKRDGSPARHPMGRHLLLVGLSGRGKSNALRCHVYADRLAIYAGLKELWGLDGKGGVEIGYMDHLFGRYCYGDGDDPEHFYAEQFAAITEDARRIMLRRLYNLRGKAVAHTPTVGDPALEVIVDEMLVFAAEFIPSNVQNRIFSNIALIQRLGRAANVTVLGCAQDPRKADLPNRGGFTDFRVFKVNDPLDVDLAMGRGAHARGATSDTIPFDQQGTCFEDNDEGGTPEEMRYPFMTDTEMKNLPTVKDVLGRQSAFPEFQQPFEAPPQKRYRSRAPREDTIDPDDPNIIEGEIVEDEPDSEPELLAIGAGPRRPKLRRMRKGRAA